MTLDYGRGGHPLFFFVRYLLVQNLSLMSDFIILANFLHLQLYKRQRWALNHFFCKIHMVIFTGKVNQKRNSASNFSMKNFGLVWTLKCVKFILQTKLLHCFELSNYIFSSTYFLAYHNRNI